jgi:hypothetical protein
MDPMINLPVPTADMLAKAGIGEHIIALEQKQEYKNLVRFPEGARLLRFLVAMFSFYARVFDPKAPEGYRCPIDQHMVDRVRGYIEGVGTDNLWALFDVVIDEAGYERVGRLKELERSLNRKPNAQ